MFLERLHTAVSRAGSPLCVGLDPDPKLIPAHLGEGPSACRRFVFEIIAATREKAAAYKANTAFFEAYGHEGVVILEELREQIGPEVLLIADAKRGDVMHTNEAYARALFEIIRADAVTVQPYLGGEPLAPFCRDPDRGMFVLCATSNPGAAEVQGIKTKHGHLFVDIARLAKQWSAVPNVGLVVGTTKPAALEAVLAVAADLPLLLPGGGAQGGDTPAVLNLLRHHHGFGLFTFSRSILYASSGKDFATAARIECERLVKELNL